MDDGDWELLDAHLDDALSPIDVAHLRVRLSAEPQLAAALETLRSERAARAAVWRALEPAPAATTATIDRAPQQGCRAERWAWARRLVAAGLAAAACVAVGWVGKGLIAGGRGADHTPALTGAYRVALTDSAGNVLAVQTFNRLDEAQRFAADLTNWQSAQQRARDGQMVLIADEF